jgi:hypothetical protein
MSASNILSGNAKVPASSVTSQVILRPLSFSMVSDSSTTPSVTIQVTFTQIGKLVVASFPPIMDQIPAANTRFVATFPSPFIPAGDMHFTIPVAVYMGDTGYQNIAGIMYFVGNQFYMVPTVNNGYFVPSGANLQGTQNSVTITYTVQ